MSTNFQRTKTRREFLKDGLRTVLFGGFIFSSAFLGLRKNTNKDSTSTCAVNLPCDNCSKLRNCEEPKARYLRHERHELTPESPKVDKLEPN